MSEDKDLSRHPESTGEKPIESQELPAPKPGRRSRLGYLAWIVTVLVAGGLLTTVLVLRTLSNQARDAGERVAQALNGAFTRNVTHEFITTAPTLRSEANLEIASITMHEVCTRTERDRTPLWPDSEHHISLTVPVTYRYYVPWDDEWNIVLDHHPASEDNRPPAAIVVNVIAPKIRAALPPAPDTSELTIRRYNNWIGNLPHKDLLENVVREWTPEFSRKANSEEYIGLIRELGRRQISLFVRSWAQLQQGTPPNAKVLVEVRFRDEIEQAPLELPSEVRQSKQGSAKGPKDI